MLIGKRAMTSSDCRYKEIVKKKKNESTPAQWNASPSTLEHDVRRARLGAGLYQKTSGFLGGTAHGPPFWDRLYKEHSPPPTLNSTLVRY